MIEHTHISRILESYCCISDNEKAYFYTIFGDLIECDLKDGSILFREHLESNGDIPKVNSLFKCESVIYRIDDNNKYLMKEGNQKWIELSSAKPLLVEVHGETLVVLYDDGTFFYDIDVRNKDYKYKKIFQQTHPISILPKGCFDNKISIYDRNNKILTLFNYIGEKIETINLEKIGGAVLHITANKEGEINILNSYNQIWRINEKKECECLWEERGNQRKEKYWGRVHQINDEYILMPWFGEEINCVNIKEKKVRKIETPDDFEYFNTIKFFRYEEKDNYILYPNRSVRYMMRLDKNTGEIKWIKPRQPSYEEIVTRIRQMMPFLHKYEAVITLNEYMDIAADDNVDNNIPNKESNGKRIWTTLKNMADLK